MSRAVNAYIDDKLTKLGSLKDCDQRTQVRNIMRQRVNGTFLWVTLVFKELEKVKRWRVLKVLKKLPAGLEELYDLIMAQVQQLRINKEDWECYQLVLSATTLAYRPLSLPELTIVSGLPEKISAVKKYIIEIVAMCGLFLTIRNNHVYLVHQSIKDYFNSKAKGLVFPSGRSEAHRTLFRRSLHYISNTLRRNIYELDSFGFTISELDPPNPDPLAVMRYSCVHWVDHFYNMYRTNSYPRQKSDFCGGDTVRLFLEKRFLYWLEALSLLRSISEGVLSMGKLETLLKVSTGASHRIIQKLTSKGAKLRPSTARDSSGLAPVYSP